MAAVSKDARIGPLFKPRPERHDGVDIITRARHQPDAHAVSGIFGLLRRRFQGDMAQYVVRQFMRDDDREFIIICGKIEHRGIDLDILPIRFRVNRPPGNDLDPRRTSRITGKFDPFLNAAVAHDLQFSRRSRKRRIDHRFDLPDRRITCIWADRRRLLTVDPINRVANLQPCAIRRTSWRNCRHPDPVTQPELRHSGGALADPILRQRVDRQPRDRRILRTKRCIGRLHPPAHCRNPCVLGLKSGQRGIGSNRGGQEQSKHSTQIQMIVPERTLI